MTTVAATDALASIEAKVIADAPMPTDTDTQVRVHLSADSPAVDVAVDGGDVVVAGLEYPNATEYLTLPAAEYDHGGPPHRRRPTWPSTSTRCRSTPARLSALVLGSLADGTFMVLPAVDAPAHDGRHVGRVRGLSQT